MLGSEFFDEYAKDLSERLQVKMLSDSQLAIHLGMSLQKLKGLRGKELSAGQIVDIVRRRANAAESESPIRKLLNNTSML